MGLDMYLFKRKKGEEEEEEEVGYWRKANQIREFFVRECGYDKNSNCEYFLLKKEDLLKLDSICKELYKEYEDENNYEVSMNLERKCREVLPTKEGFFFGDTEYDEWYFEDLKNTIDILNGVINNTDWETEEIFYYEWW